MEHKATIKSIGETIHVSDKFQKREFIVEDNSSTYPQTNIFQLVQDKCDVIDSFKPGDEVKVMFNLTGREWTNAQGEVKVFNTLSAWSVVKI
ncbi:MAG: DUF3127 domain-containing protein [Nitrososphaerales archaeon]